MTTIKEIFIDFSPEYIHKFSPQIPATHLKVINAILSCRTQDRGWTVYSCKSCGKVHKVFRSCGNRHCPACQNHKTRDWLAAQCRRQMPGHHFMVTFTVPGSLRGVIRSHQRVSYNAMFKASSYAIKRLSPDPRYLGGDLSGFFGVLHTWGRTLCYHPHIHFIVPGGAYDKHTGCWHAARQDFLLPERALARVFKAKFLSLLKKAGLLNRVPFEARVKEWNVDCKPAGSGVECTKYLAPYVFKVGISNARIVKVENQTVYYRVKKTGSRRLRTCRLPVMEFMRRFLQHVLPTGFMKVRYYGFLHPGCSVSLEQIRVAVEAALGEKHVRIEITITRYVPQCPDCGGELEYVCSVLPYMFGPPGPG